VNIYAESSAVLAWLLGEEAGHRVGEVLRRAELVAASDLTLLECDRVLIRTVATGEVDEATAADRRARLNAAAAHWHMWRVSWDIIDRARNPFPGEPVRTLDAIHLASALAVPSAVPGVELLALDDRIRRSGRQLGFRLQPG
jgi:predicted nucleic acid-binding protein